MAFFEDISQDRFTTASAAFAAGGIPSLPRRSKLKTPFEDPALWNTVSFQGNFGPGKWKVTGVRARTIEQPKKKGSNKNTLIDQGIAPGEVDFEVETWTGQQLRDLQDFYDKYLSPDRLLVDANVTTVAHPALYARNIKQVYGFKATFPEPQGDKGDVRMVSRFTAKVFTDLTKIGGEGSKKPKPTIAAGNFGSSRLDVLVSAAQLAVTGLFAIDLKSADVQALLQTAGINVNSLGLQAPAATSPVILPFKDASALSILSGSIPDGMVTDVALARAPR